MDLYFDDNGIARALPEYQITVCFETEDEMNKFSSMMKSRNKYRWHDLRKNAEDLPDYRELVLICKEYKNGHVSYNTDTVSGSGFWSEPEENEVDFEVIAWRYIEPFEEVSE